MKMGTGGRREFSAKGKLLGLAKADWASELLRRNPSYQSEASGAGIQEGVLRAGWALSALCKAGGCLTGDVGN